MAGHAALGGGLGGERRIGSPRLNPFVSLEASSTYSDLDAMLRNSICPVENDMMTNKLKMNLPRIRNLATRALACRMGDVDHKVDMSTGAFLSYASTRAVLLNSFLWDSSLLSISSLLLQREPPK